MNLKLRLAGMMILLLMAVMAVQYFLAERQQRELVSRLADLTAGVEQSTLDFSRQASFVHRRDKDLDSLFVVVEGETFSDDLTLTRHYDEEHVIRDEDSLLIEMSTSPGKVDKRLMVRSMSDTLLRRILAREGIDLDDSNAVVDHKIEIRTLDDSHEYALTGIWTSDPRARPDELAINLPVPFSSGGDAYLLRMTYPLDAITAELDASRKRGFLWLSLLLGVGVLGATLVAVQFTRPITSLQQSFRKVEAGDLNVRLNPSRSDEIGELTVSFNEMVGRLEETRSMEARLAEAERMASIGTMAAGVAHEVRNPLNAILLNLQQMRDKAGDNGGQEIDRYLENVTGEVSRLEKVVTSFLDFSSTQELAVAPVDLQENIAASIRLFKPEAEAKGIQLEFAGGELPPIQADASRLSTVWNNLLSNAIQATDAGGTITFSVQPGDPLCVRVTDTGAGIEADNLAQIWNPFFTGHPSGTGLGLSIVRSVAEAHGGYVDAESAPGKGTTISVLLPLERKARV